MKAIIPAAGLGTRFLPATKCTPKEMLPVLDKPVIQYVVEEALEPEEVDGAVIVTSPGKPELLSYFQPDRSLEALLRERGKDGYADAVAQAGDMPVDFRYQYEPKGLGHAIRSVADAVAGESFLVLLGDYVVPSRDICTRMLEVSRAHAGASVIAVAPCSPADVSRYGVIAGERVDTLEGLGGVADDEPGAVWRVSGLVEKPAAEEAPSNLYIVGRYLLSPLVMDLLADQEPGKGGEIQLTDAMARSLEREAMYAVVIDPLSGYDTGTP
ncbi:UTP--glucose-1-phosphate uridylyltransferase, partial [Collinsella tanakaei]